MPLQAITSLMENSKRTVICAPGFLFLEQTDRRKSESIVAAAMRRPMRSQPCAQSGLRPRFTSDRGRHGAPIHLALWQRVLARIGAALPIASDKTDYRRLI